MIQIYAMEISSPALKVLYTANYLGIEYTQKRLNMQQAEHKTDEYKRIHPAGKIPAMIDGDFTLFESNAIIRYLADKEKSDIYPSGLKERAIVDQWLDFVALHIQNGIGRVFWNKVIAKRVGQDVDEASMKCGYEFIARFFPVVDRQLGDTKYICGDKISLADFALVAHTDPVNIIGVDMNLYPNLERYRQELTAQDFYQKVHKVYGEALMAKSE